MDFATIALDDPHARLQLEAALRGALASMVDDSEFADSVIADMREGLHDKQREVFDEVVFGGPNRFLACECGRRAGKTTGAARLIIATLLTADRGEEVVFCAPTLSRGKELIWHWLEDLLERYGLTATWRIEERLGKIKTHRGALFRIVGLDNKRQVDKVSRGGNTILFVTDETQEYAHLLEKLLVGAAPALVQQRGYFVAHGTPTINEADYWAQICDGAAGFSHKHWNLRDNPYLGRDPEEVLAEERERNAWSEDHPTYVREYLGRRCRDASMMVLEIGSNNLIREIQGYDRRCWVLDEDGNLPSDDDAVAMRRQWRHFIGIDFGSSDPTAWSVLAANVFSKRVYNVHAEKAAGLTWDEVADNTLTLVKRFQPEGVVGDSATGGKQFIDSWNIRYGAAVNLWIRQAKKHDKVTSIATWNTELRKARFAWLLPEAEDAWRCCSALQWADSKRTAVLEGSAYPEDDFDATRYAFVDFWAWATKDPATQLSDEERAIRERNRRSQRLSYGRRR